LETVLLLSAIGAGTTGTVMAVQAANQQGKAAQAQAKSQAAWYRYNAEMERRNAEIRDYNAKVLERDADAARRAADFEEQQKRKEGRVLRAKQRAAFGAGGTRFIGSPLEVLTDTRYELELDYAATRMQGIVEESRLRSAAWGERAGATNQRGQAQLSILSAQAALMKGKSARIASRYQATGALLSGISEVAGYGLMMKGGAGNKRYDGKYYA